MSRVFARVHRQGFRLKVGASLLSFSTAVATAAQAQSGAAASDPLASTLATARASMALTAKHPAITRAMDAVRSDNAWTLGQQVSLCEIPAPPFKEAARGVAFRERLISIGVQNVRIDREGNVIGEIRGTRPGPTVLLSGHLDTVFPEGTNVTVKREGTKMIAPGISDDCRGLAVVLATARQIIAAKVPIAGRLLIVGSVGEEGPGNLRGVRAIFNSPLKDSINTFISIDGTGYSITNGGVGSDRYRVTYYGPGGHSYGAFGMPNPIHAMGRAIARIADLQATSEPKVTFNVGVVSGGTSVNSISDKGVMDIDLRSESAAALGAIDAKLQAALRDALRDERARWPQSKVPLEMKIDTIGLRAAGRTPDSAHVVITARAASAFLGLTSTLESQSSDANVAMSLGIPSITLDGGGTGFGAHSLAEWYDDGRDGYKGPQWVLLIVSALLGVK